MTTVFVTGITGQDGTLLASRLVSEGCTVHGLVQSWEELWERRASFPDGVVLHVGGRDPYAVADDLSLPLQVTRGGGSEATGAPVGRALAIEGAEVSAVQRQAGQLVVRVFNPRPEPTTVTLDGRAGWLVDLRGRPQRPFEGRFDLAPWAIATVNSVTRRE